MKFSIEIKDGKTVLHYAVGDSENMTMEHPTTSEDILIFATGLNKISEMCKQQRDYQQKKDIRSLVELAKTLTEKKK